MEINNVTVRKDGVIITLADKHENMLAQVVLSLPDDSSDVFNVHVWDGNYESEDPYRDMTFKTVGYCKLQEVEVS